MPCAPQPDFMLSECMAFELIVFACIEDPPDMLDDCMELPCAVWPCIWSDIAFFVQPDA